MSYNSILFALFFLLMLGTFSLTPNRHKWKTLLIFSLLFYSTCGIKRMIFILATSIVVYCSTRWMAKIYAEFDEQCKNENLTSPEKTAALAPHKKRCKRILISALVFDVGCLAICKYTGTTLGYINRFFGTSLAVRVIVPLGISYYTFSSIGYLLDVYWRKTVPSANYPKLLLCMCYFGHIVEGPITRYQKLLPQFENMSNPDYHRLTRGLQLMLWGYIKKIVIADRLAIFTNSVFGNIDTNEGFVIIVAMLFSSFRNYADFSGCMDVVYGASEIVGINLDKNFQQPFFSSSIAEFWRRWHMTLGAWFKDYIYLPLAVSPKVIAISGCFRKRFGKKAGVAATTVLCQATVWLLTGLWHGANARYIAWGIYFGFIISTSAVLSKSYARLDKKLKIDTDSNYWKKFRVMRTFCIFTVGNLFYSVSGMRKLFTAVKNIFATFNIWVFWDNTLYNYGLDRRNFLVAILSIVLLLWVDKLQQKGSVREMIEKKPLLVRWLIYYMGIFTLLILGIYGPGYNPSAFIYQNF